MAYLAILLSVTACLGLLDARFRLFVWHRPARAVLTLAAGTVFFLGWDVWAIAEGIFLHRDSPLMTGIMLSDQLPLEEAFFLLFLCYQTMVLFTGFLRLQSHRNRRKEAACSTGS